MCKTYDGMIGIAIGDALGVPVEFVPRNELAKDPVTSMRGYGTHHQPPGTWSDDTSLTLALLDSLVKNHSVHYEDIMDKFSEWLLYNEYTATGDVFDVGNATARAIMNYGRGIDPLLCGGPSQYDNGNGSLMRILPAVFYIHTQYELSFGSQMELIHNLSSLTHRHPISLIGCGIYSAVALELLTAKTSLSACIQQGINQAFSYYEKLEWLELSEYARLKNIASFAALEENAIESTGYIVHTLEAALWCLLNTASYASCVLKAVNLGDDTDTTAAVVGGLAGIYYGASSIPQQWLDTLQKSDYMPSSYGEDETFSNHRGNLMKFLANRKLATRISILTTIITFTGLLLLWLIVSSRVADMVENNITNQMIDAVESRAAIINDYVASAEEYMTAFALGSEVLELLEHPDDAALLRRAQQYTEDFAAVKGIFEGLYIATPTTHVLTHTSEQAIGITTRSGDSLEEFQNTILAQPQLTNLGIMKSPGTGNMILSMYYPLFDNEKCIGYVGPAFMPAVSWIRCSI